MGFKHGMSRSSEYGIWSTMKTRCTNPKFKQYADYGGRGIRVCPEWLNSFETFLADMGRRPVGLTLERKDTNGGYTPDNCIWASHKTQARNKSNNIRVDVNGRSLVLMDAAKSIGVKPNTVYHLLALGDRTPQQAIDFYIGRVGYTRSVKHRGRAP